MTSLNNGLAAGVAMALCLPAWAGLGDTQDAISADQLRMKARHTVVTNAQYAVHALQSDDGAHVQQYVGRDGRVFAVVWNTQYKPDLTPLLSSSYPSYEKAARLSAQRPGIQRQFRHEGLDLVVQARSHLNVYAGFAYRQSLLPPGFSPASFGLE